MSRRNLDAPLRVAVYENGNGKTFRVRQAFGAICTVSRSEDRRMAHGPDDRLAALIADLSRSRRSSGRRHLRIAFPPLMN
jgi:hypothetical protein